jgi:hypothetical protein
MLVFYKCFGVQVLGTPWPLHTSVPHPTVLYFLPHWGHVSFKFGGVDKHFVCLFVCFTGCFD